MNIGEGTLYTPLAKMAKHKVVVEKNWKSFSADASPIKSLTFGQTQIVTMNKKDCWEVYSGAKSFIFRQE